MTDITADSGLAPAAATGSPNNAATKKRKTPKSALGWGAAASLLIAIVIACRVNNPAWAWVWCLGLLVAFSIMAGIAVNDRAAGLIIDNRNRVSLSKFQAWAWSMVVLSALLTGAIFRLRLGFADPIAITLPPDLLAAMGISAASMVAAPALLSLKSNDDPAPDALAQTTAKLGESPDTADPAGKVFARSDPKYARWLDMFRGEEVGNAASPDLSKVQQFLVTVIVLLIYAGSIWNALSGVENLRPEKTGPAFFATLPLLSQTMVGLIAISHAGYLAYKAAPHTQSAPAT